MGKEDERHLWPFMFKAIKEIRPKYVVGENVRGLLNWSDGLVLEEVFSDLESEGYEVQAFVLPAVGISAPHRRDRVFIVAHANSDAGRSESYQGGCTECKTDSDGQSSLYFRTESASNEGTTTHTERLRLELSQIATDLSSISSETQTQGGQSAIDTSPDDYVRTQQGGPSETWVNFPTKSPLCSGDDGLPHELDGLAFPKWRKESIMGYGNAIIPQIAHRIFQTIHATEQ